MDNIELFNRYLKKDLTAKQIEQLKKILKTPEGRREFKRFMAETSVVIQSGAQMQSLEIEDAAISELVKNSERKLLENLNGQQPSEREKIPESKKTLSANHLIFLSLLGVAAAIVFLVLTNPGKSNTTVDEGLVKSVARVTMFKGKGSVAHKTWLKPGEILLDEGEMEITFDSGAVVLLQGRSSIRLESDKRAFLNYGKMSARVPEEAVGFIVNTPQGTVVDLGTEFAVNVDENKAMEVHVIEGEVEAGSFQGEQPKLLKKDESLRIENGGRIVADTEYDFTSFSRVPEQSSKIDYNYIHWSFDEVYGQTVKDTGNGGMGGTFDLVLPDSRKNLSRGKLNKALYLSGKKEYARSSFPGIGAANPRTVAFWIKVPPDSTQKEAYAVVSWGKVAPSQKWQVGYNPNPENGVVGAIRTEFSLGYVIGTTDLRDGRWHHVVSMFIGGERPDVATHVRHYVDGKLEGVSGYRSRKINTNISGPDTQPVFLGKYINNREWYFRGKIDEFYIFDGALTPAQISLLREGVFK